MRNPETRKYCKNCDHSKAAHHYLGDKKTLFDSCGVNKCPCQKFEQRRRNYEKRD